MYDSYAVAASSPFQDTMLAILQFIFSWKALILVAVAIALPSILYVVHGKTAVVLETLGKPHDRAVLPGLHAKIPFITKIVARMNLQLQQIADDIEVKTKDNAFIKLPTKTQYRVSEDAAGIVRSHYELSDAQKQIKAFIFNKIRQIASAMTMEELYEAQDQISHQVADALREKFAQFGFIIENVLVDQPQPSTEVQQSFNRVIASKRLLEAAQNEADATKAKLIGVAQGEKESKKLQGEGMAAMREAIAAGFEKAMEMMMKAGVSEEDAASFLLETARLDTIAGAAAHGNMIIIDSKSHNDAMASTIAAIRSQAGKPRAVEQAA